MVLDSAVCPVVMQMQQILGRADWWAKTGGVQHLKCLQIETEPYLEGM